MQYHYNSRYGNEVLLTTVHSNCLCFDTYSSKGIILTCADSFHDCMMFEILGTFRGFINTRTLRDLVDFCWLVGCVLLCIHTQRKKQQEEKFINLDNKYKSASRNLISLVSRQQSNDNVDILSKSWLYSRIYFFSPLYPFVPSLVLSDWKCGREKDTK